MKPASSPACRMFCPSGTSKLCPLGFRVTRCAMSMTQVCPLDMRLCCQLARRAGGDDAPLFEHVGAALEVQGGGDVLLDQQHRHPARVDVADDAEHLEHDGR